MPPDAHRDFFIHTLYRLYGGATTFLHHASPFQLLIAVILSAQCTDDRVNLTTPKLFNRFGTPASLANASVEEVAAIIKSVNYYRTKSKNIIETAKKVYYQFQDRVPDTLADLISLPGVGRKTANVLLGQCFHQPAITADTHVQRVTYRYGFHKEKTAESIEKSLMKKWPEKTWTNLSTYTILHGRTTCTARKPMCGTCGLQKTCAQQGIKSHPAT